MSQKELTLLISELTFRETVSTFITKPKIMKHMELLTFRGQISAWLTAYLLWKPRNSWSFCPNI